MRRVSVLLFTSALFAVTCSHTARAGSAVSAVRATLSNPLDARAGIGTPFALNTIQGWKSGNCAVPAKTVIQGKVAGWKRRKEGSSREEVALSFAAVSCYGAETIQVVPVLIAMRGPRNPYIGALGDQERKDEMMPLATVIPTTPTGPGGGPKMTNMGNGGSEVFFGDLQKITGHGVDNFTTGEVRGFNHVGMTLPLPGSNVTILISTNAIEFKTGTEFVFGFLPLSAMDPKSLASIGAPNSAAAPSGPSVPESLVANETAPTVHASLCAAGCLHFDETAVTAAAAVWKLSLVDAGLRPRATGIITDLDDDASVHFLGEDQLLVTFNIHSLSRRAQGNVSHPRDVRAMVIYRSTGLVLQTVEWRVEDAPRFTWQLDHGQVLVHIADELVSYGPDLKVQARYKLLGPLVFAEIAPGDHASEGLIAVVTTHEGHVAKAAGAAGRDKASPDNEAGFDLAFLDTKLHLIGSKRIDVEPAPVALVTTGMVSAARDHGQSWKIEEEDWHGKPAVLARMDSDCAINPASLPGALLFATTCADDHKSSLEWLLNGKGVPLLSGHAPDKELVQQAASSADGGVVAIATTWSTAPLNLPLGARLVDFHKLIVAAYRVADGKKILFAEAPEGSALRQTFAIAPSGSGIAVLSGSVLEMYAVDRESGTAKTIAAATSPR